MHFSELISQRRSCRHYDEGDILPDEVQSILMAALLAPTSMNRRAWHFVVVEDKAMLEKLADSKEQGSSFVKDAALAVVVTGNPNDNDCWIEDGSIAATFMQLQAEELGLGTCWVQIRGRRISDGTLSSDIVKGILDIPEDMQVLCIVAIGKKQRPLPSHADDELLWEKVHIDKY